MFSRLYHQYILRKMKICTHDGKFHCDEVLACMMLTEYTSKFKGAEIIRSRDPKIWQQCHVVVDVGGKYDPPRYLDHHQIQFNLTHPQHSIRLSSAGLVYITFPQIIPNVVSHIIKKQAQNLPFKPIVNQSIIKQIQDRIYSNFIIYIDANDNGIDKVNEKNISTIPTTLWSRVSKINPMWWDQKSNQNELFKLAINLVAEEFYSEVRNILLGSIQTIGIVKEAVLKRMEIHQSGKIVLLQKYVPWQSTINAIEQQLKCEGELLFMVFPDKNASKWRIQAVGKEGSFELRNALKQEWRGIKDIQKLIEISGIDDITFVHANGFIGGATSRESTIKMGVLSIL